MATFNLVTEPWLPVVREGRRELVALDQALTDAHLIDGLAIADPLQVAAVLRQVLLPVYLDACGAPRSPAEWGRRWQGASLDGAAISSYLTQHEERFDLFGQRPFAQVAGLCTPKGETKPTSVLIASAATGNNVPLFSVRTETEPVPLTPAEAVLALLATHCWDTAAIKSGAVGDDQVKAGKTTGNPTGPLGGLGVVIPLGDTLAQTLLLNTPVLVQGLRPADRPQWRAENVGPAWEKRPALGLLDLLTWQSRRIRLVAEDDEQGRTVVRQVVLAAGDRLASIPIDVEPHSAWKRVAKPKAGQPAVVPVRHQPGREAWRGLQPLLATDSTGTDGDSSSLLLRQVESLRNNGYLPEDLPLQVLTVGVVYGNQSAVIEDVIADLIPLPVKALDPSGPVRLLLSQIVAEAEELRRAANDLGDNLRRAVGGDKLPWDKGQRLGDALVHQFTPVVRRILGGLQREPDRDEEAQAAWRETAYRTALDFAEPMLACVPPEAFLGRGNTSKEEYRASVAEAWYRSRVRRVLGVEKDAPTRSREGAPSAA